MTSWYAIDHHGWIGTETIETRVGQFDFAEGYPAGDTAKRLTDLQVFYRAVEVYLEQMPAVSMHAIRKGLAGFGATSSNQVVLWQKVPNDDALVLAGDSRPASAIAFIDLKRDGPTVIETAAGLVGGVSDMWQQPVVDIGTTGADGGQGGRFLILPPSFQGVPRDGFITTRARTFGVMFVARGFVGSATNSDVARLETLAIFPLARAANRPATTFLNGSDRDIDTVFCDGYEFFEDLARLVEQEPADVLSSRERFFLSAIGIQKGKPFRPDAQRRKLLGEAARLGSAIARARTFASRDPERLVYPDRQWEWPAVGGSATFDSEGFVNTDRRAAFAYAACGMLPAMFLRATGVQSPCKWTMRDVNGAFLEGGRSYRLRLPANLPPQNCWSLVVYDAESRSVLRNEGGNPSVCQYTGPETNYDGSVDIYFSPHPPRGRERNWIETVDGTGWFPLLRLYGPLESLDATWKPGDIEEV
ncbi:MAG: DUF1214 domain-containing protein [Gemmatimonadaceae bacterium]